MKSLTVLRTYAQALRGDWGIDGRSEKVSLNAIADAIEAEHAGELIDPKALADRAGVCLSCGAWLNGSLCDHDTNLGKVTNEARNPR
jgi:hypothetical protein